MVFSSFPVYLDHPNLHQFQQPDHQQGTEIENPRLPPPLSVGGDGGGGSAAAACSIRPGSMVDRARLAKIPLPEAGLKCPRCDSTNTKFCYFNNYNLSQPRHFCKTCRRYWTRGGALRNVPVGGGCRRNKRSKASTATSKSSSTNNNTCTTSANNNTNKNNLSQPSTHHQFPLMAAALQNHLNQYGSGPSIGGFQPPQMGSGITDDMVVFSNFSSSATTSGAEQWKLSSLAGFGPSINLFPFQDASSSSLIGEGDINRLNIPSGTADGISESQQVKQLFLGASESNYNQQWATSTWSGISGLNSSSSASCSHLL